MQNKILATLEQLKHRPHVDTAQLEALIERARKDSRVIKAQDTTDHFNVMFIPIDTKTKRMFFVHHKKAADWIPPGGHIDMGETPEQAVRREFEEELDLRLTDERVELFDISIKNVNNPAKNCIIHNDFWYLVYLAESNFKWDKREFHDARWMTHEEALQQMQCPEFGVILKKIIVYVQNGSYMTHE